MPKRQSPASSNLSVPISGKFFGLSNPLSDNFVRRKFSELLADAGAARVGAAEIRVNAGTGAQPAYVSFVCAKLSPVATFLRTPALRETRYGFVLIIERNQLVAVFSKGIAGADGALAGRASMIPRDRLTHVWGHAARYQKLSTRRMTIGQHEVRKVTLESDDLAMSMPANAAGRSIPQSFRLALQGEESRVVTPSTGRLQQPGARVSVTDLIRFMDEVSAELAANRTSVFLQAFSVPLQLSGLPTNVSPTGVLIDLSGLQDLLSDGWHLNPPQGQQVSDLFAALSPIQLLQPVPGEDAWVTRNGRQERLKLKRLTDSYSVAVKAAEGWTLDDGQGQSIEITRWLRREAVFSVTYSDPAYFYAMNSLYRRAGFMQDAQRVLALLQSQPSLAGAVSEKGPVNQYNQNTRHFSADSIFRVLETTMIANEDHVICTDLQDEWADYLSIGPGSVTFYHCKDGDPTTGASAFHVVTAQAQKNLSRVRLTPAEIVQKLTDYQQSPKWMSTKGITRLVKGPGWPAAINAAKAAIADPTKRWRVALVATALSRQSFVAAMQGTPDPFFIQLVWLLSGFAALCRDNEAEPVVYCRP